MSGLGRLALKILFPPRSKRMQRVLSRASKKQLARVVERLAITASYWDQQGCPQEGSLVRAALDSIIEKRFDDGRLERYITPESDPDLFV